MALSCPGIAAFTIWARPMTVIEAGILAGTPAGAIVGGTACQECANIKVAASALGGALLGGGCGWLYALAVICLMAVIGVLWRAARRTIDVAVTEANIALMTPIASGGTMLGVFAALAFWLLAGWLQGLTAAAAIGAATAVAAVARCELQSGGEA